MRALESGEPVKLCCPVERRARITSDGKSICPWYSRVTTVKPAAATRAASSTPRQPPISAGRPEAVRVRGARLPKAALEEDPDFRRPIAIAST